MKHPDLLLFHGRLISPPERPVALGPELALSEIADGAIVAHRGKIVDLGPTAEVLERTTPGPDTRMIDAQGRAVLPGLVDPHTHMLYALDRMDEMELRHQGRGYLEILAAGGGILKSMRDFRATDDDTLAARLLERLKEAVASGTVALEVKSGYGLSLKEEMRALGVIEKVRKLTAFPIVPTLMAAHALLPDVEREAYLKECDQAATRAAKAGLAKAADVFVEEGVFTPEEGRRLLTHARQAGLRVRLHADELAPSGGAELAAELGAVSADHLTAATDEGLAEMARAGVTAVVLPGTSFFLHRAPLSAERVRQAGLIAALATDCNPGSSPFRSMAMMVALAFHQNRFTVAEALTMATINAAHVIGEALSLGSLTVGKRCSLFVLSGEDVRDLVYRPGAPLAWAVVESGRVLIGQGRPTEEVATWTIS